MFPQDPVQVMRLGQEHYMCDVSSPVRYIRRHLRPIGSITRDLNVDDVLQVASRFLCREVTIFTWSSVITL